MGDIKIGDWVRVRHPENYGESMPKMRVANIGYNGISNLITVRFPNGILKTLDYNEFKKVK